MYVPTYIHTYIYIYILYDTHQIQEVETGLLEGALRRRELPWQLGGTGVGFWGLRVPGVGRRVLKTACGRFAEESLDGWVLVHALCGSIRAEAFERLSCR